MVEEGTKPPMPAAKTKPDIPPPEGGYQKGEGPLIDGGRQVEKAGPEEQKEEEEESDEEFECRMKEDLEKLKKQWGSSSVDDSLWRQLERLKFKRCQK